MHTYAMFVIFWIGSRDRILAIPALMMNYMMVSLPWVTQGEVGEGYRMYNVMARLNVLNCSSLSVECGGIAVYWLAFICSWAFEMYIHVTKLELKAGSVFRSLISPDLTEVYIYPLYMSFPFCTLKAI